MNMTCFFKLSLLMTCLLITGCGLSDVEKLAIYESCASTTRYHPESYEIIRDEALYFVSEAGMSINMTTMMEVESLNSMANKSHMIYDYNSYICRSIHGDTEAGVKRPIKVILTIFIYTLVAWFILRIIRSKSS